MLSWVRFQDVADYGPAAGKVGLDAKTRVTDFNDFVYTLTIPSRRGSNTEIQVNWQAR